MSLDRTQTGALVRRGIYGGAGFRAGVPGRRASQLACTAPAGGRHAGQVRRGDSRKARQQFPGGNKRFPLPGEPCIWIGAPRRCWRQLAARVLGAAGVEDDSQARETYLEILQQSLGELARSAGRRWDRPIDSFRRRSARGAPPRRILRPGSGLSGCHHAPVAYSRHRLSARSAASRRNTRHRSVRSAGRDRAGHRLQDVQPADGGGVARERFVRPRASCP